MEKTMLETIKRMPRKKLEEFCVYSLNVEFLQTERANFFEDVLKEIKKYAENKEHTYSTTVTPISCRDELLLKREILDIVNKALGNDK